MGATAEDKRGARIFLVGLGDVDFQYYVKFDF